MLVFGGKNECRSDNAERKRAKFPYGPVNKLSEVFRDTQVQHNKMEIEMEHENAGRIKQVHI